MQAKEWIRHECEIDKNGVSLCEHAECIKSIIKFEHGVFAVVDHNNRQMKYFQEVFKASNIRVWGGGCE